MWKNGTEVKAFSGKLGRTKVFDAEVIDRLGSSLRRSRRKKASPGPFQLLGSDLRGE